ncbi:MAG TPA: hypothetical protein VEC56_06545 [Candidatus Krumholzibacteria bacterium]|nr:hypothetical protein [Candidatus Krumholzibacteria bacterium]
MTTRARLFVLVALCAGLVPARARAESSPGGAFRLPAYGARGWGMAGAFVARVDDESAVDWNPAGLGIAPRSAGASYLQLIEGVSAGQSQIVFTMPLSRERHENGAARHAAGAMFTNLSADVVGGESYSENYLRVAYALTPEPLVSFGLAATAFMSSSGVPGFDAWGTSFDISGMLSLSRAWSMALVARDAFSRYSYDDGRDYEKEPQYVVGLAWQRAKRFAVEGDVVRSYGGWSRASLGVESEYFLDHLALRGGIAWLSAGESRTVPSFGASVRALSNRLTLHYGATLDEEDAFGRTHRVSLAVGI